MTCDLSRRKPPKNWRPQSLHLYCCFLPLRPFLTTLDDPQKKHFFCHINNNLCKYIKINILQGFYPTFCRLDRFLWARMCFGTNYSTTEYEHDISPFYWKSTYYKQGLFVDSTPEYGVRTVGFHILLYINIIPKQHVRSPVTLNVTSGVVNAGSPGKPCYP